MNSEVLRLEQGEDSIVLRVGIDAAKETLKALDDSLMAMPLNMWPEGMVQMYDALYYYLKRLDNENVRWLHFKFWQDKERR